MSNSCSVASIWAMIPGRLTALQRFANVTTLNGRLPTRRKTGRYPMGNVHLDPSNCLNSADIGAFGCYDDTDNSLTSSKYKVSSAMRIISYSDAVSRIYSFAGKGTPLTVEEFMEKLDAIASNLDTSYAGMDCAKYIYNARNGQGAYGASSELGYHVEFFGSIEDLGGYSNLIPGMQLFQGFRKTATSNSFYSSHIGVYAGMQLINGTRMPAV